MDKTHLIELTEKFDGDDLQFRQIMMFGFEQLGQRFFDKLIEKFEVQHSEVFDWIWGTKFAKSSHRTIKRLLVDEVFTEVMKLK